MLLISVHTAINVTHFGTTWRISIFQAVEKKPAVAQSLRCCATNRKVAGSIPASVTGFFIDIKFFRSHYGLGADSASTRNEYQEHFLGVKAAGPCVIVGPCHHGMARPQVADRGTASNK